MTQAQETFKKAIAYRKKTGCSLKEAFAYVKKNKPTKTKKLGALPVGFVGTFFDISFKIINQFDIYNNVNSIIEDKANGNVITTITGNQNSLVNTDMFLNYAKRNSKYSVKEWDSIKSKINKFFELIKKEVKNYNSGKSKTIKKQPIKILAPAKFVKTEVKKTRQTGVSNLQYDKMKQALPAGKRTSASGNVYYENRRNRSDAGVLLGFFDTTVIKDIDNLKKQYFKLAKIYHPDKGGTTTQFQELGREYDKLLKTLLSGSSLTDEQQKNEIEIDEAIKQIIDAIITFDGLNIELIGSFPLTLCLISNDLWNSVM